MKKLTDLCIFCLIIILLPGMLSALQFARWHTTMGVFTATLRDEIVPITANNFINLTNSGFYDGLHFHRVVQDFVIQDGCPYGTGYGGPGYTIQDEFSPLLHHDSPGVLAMARTSLPNSAGSQYYITLAPTPWLDGNYAIFGKVFEGLDVVMAIGDVAVDSNNHPISNVDIDSLRILDLIIYNVSPAPDNEISFDSANPQTFVVEGFNPDLTVVYQWFIDDILQPQQTDMFMVPVFNSNGNHTVKCLTTTTQISWTTVWQVNVSNVSNQDETLPNPVLKLLSLAPNPFRKDLRIDFSIDKSRPVNISVFDCKGRMVDNQNIASTTGINSWRWKPELESSSSIKSGVYVVRISTPTAQSTGKIILIK